MRTIIKISKKNSSLNRELVLVLVFLAFLNVESFAQEAAADKASGKDVVEIETEIGIDQIKRSDTVSKPGIKPRAVYNEMKKVNKSKPAVSKPAVTSDVTGDPKTMPSSNEPVRAQGQGSEDAVPETKTAVPASEPAPVKKTENALTDVQVVEISSSLRKLIEENEGLKKELDELGQQLKTVRGQQKLDNNRLTEIAMERDALKKQNENIIALGAKSEESLTKLQNQLTEKETQYNQQIVVLQTELAKTLQVNTPAKTEPAEQLASADQVPAPNAKTQTSRGKPAKAGEPGKRSVSVDVASVPTAVSEEAKKQGEKVLMDLDSVTHEKAKLTRDEAKLHYNMGNTYFNEGDYQRAVTEYGRAVELAPEDANAHYNLAFVSGDFLNDPAAALKHYKLYLFLNPGAEDAQMVRQKMIEAEISVKADVRFQSTIDKEVKQKKNEFNESTQF